MAVIRNPHISRKSSKKISIGQSRVWLVATSALSEKVSNAEKAFEKAGYADAKKHLRGGGYEVNFVRWTGKNRFREEAKPGDLIIEVFTEKRGKRKHTEVYKAAPILHRQNEPQWTRFYYEVPVDGRNYYSWKDIKTDFKSLGIINITPKSTRELTGKALSILQMME